MDIVSTLTDPKFLIAVFAAVSAAAVVFTLGSSFLGGQRRRSSSASSVSPLEREKLRAEEMSRLRGSGKERGVRARSAASPARST